MVCGARRAVRVVEMAQGRGDGVGRWWRRRRGVGRGDDRWLQWVAAGVGVRLRQRVQVRWRRGGSRVGVGVGVRMGEEMWVARGSWGGCGCGRGGCRYAEREGGGVPAPHDADGRIGLQKDGRWTTEGRSTVGGEGGLGGGGWAVGAKAVKRGAVRARRMAGMSR